MRVDPDLTIYEYVGVEFVMEQKFTFRTYRYGEVCYGRGYSYEDWPHLQPTADQCAPVSRLVSTAWTVSIPVTLTSSMHDPSR